MLKYRHEIKFLNYVTIRDVSDTVTIASHYYNINLSHSTEH